jgi:hypothetical protein
MILAELSLPQEILAQASVDGLEYAWPIDFIPEVIEAARVAKLVNIGGQLQFRLEGCGTCECYWIEVDTYKSVSTFLPWQERVVRTANAALSSYAKLRLNCDFLAEGRRAFPKAFADYEHLGRAPADAMFFVWYFASFEETQSHEMKVL